MNPMPTNKTRMPLRRTMKPSSNWLDALHTTLGANGAESSLWGLDGSDMEVYTTSAGELVLVDRAPVKERGGTAFLRSSVRQRNGAQLNLAGEVEHMAGSVWHGVYSGLLGGAAVMMDQYVQLRNCVPITIIQVIARVNGSAAQQVEGPDELVKELLGGLDEEDGSGMPCP